MGYTQKLGLLAQSVFQDSSLNVGIGAAPSGTYKFEVTGTAKVSTSAYFAIASGSVGIGTSSPAYTLDVSGSTRTSATQPSLLINYTDATSYANLIFTESGTNKGIIQYIGSTFSTTSRRNNLEIINAANSDITFYTNNIVKMVLTSTGQLQLNNGTALRFNNTVGTPVDTLQMFTDGNVYLDAKDNTGGNLIFRNTTTLNERMRITSAGKFFFNTTTDNGGGNFQVKSPSGINAIVGQVSDNGNAGLVGFSASSGYTFYVLGSGQIYSTSTSITLISSDYNLKTDIKDYDKGLAEVLAMKPRYFKYKDNLEEEKIGFIAQEMEEVIAGSMINSPMGNHKTYQLEWYPLLVKAIQELNQQNQDLKSRLDKAGL